MKIRIILLATLIVLTSCAPSPSNSAPANPISQETPTQPSFTEVGNGVSPINTPDSLESTPPSAEKNPFIKQVEEDLAQRLNINVDGIHFLKISDIDWQDIQQGCISSPDQTLTKGRVSGYRIWLEANGQDYLYHIGLDNSIFLCTQSP